MSEERVHVAIIGGGPGGLTLAQGLRKAGVPVAVYEKSAVRADYVQGFRMRIRQRGLDALQACLPAGHYDTFLATLGRSPDRSLLLDERLKPIDDSGSLAGGQEEDTHLEKSVSRITLRQILLTGLDDVIQTGRVFERYVENDDGTVTAYFEDGGTVRADLLIGADGAFSRVRSQLLPEAGVFDTGARRLAGKITLAAAEHHGLPQIFADYNVRIKSAGGPGLMITSHKVDRDIHARFGLIGNDDPSHRDLDGFHFDNVTSYIWWNTAYPKGTLASDEALSAMSGAELLDLLRSRITDWHPDLQQLIGRSDPSTVALLKVRSSSPVEAWKTRRVTLLGDAIHSMTYFRALGGNSAIYDAGLLAAELAAAERREKPLLSAVADYERAMLAHGFDAVRGSLVALERSLAPLAA